MTLTGELTRTQIVRRIVIRTRLCLAFGGVGTAMMLYLVWTAQQHQFAIDLITEVAAIGLFPVATLAALVLINWSDRWMVVRYTCDEYSFHYWRLGSGREEPRELHDVKRVQVVYGRSGMTGYEVGFQNGGSVFLPLGLPQCHELATQLCTHCEEVLEDPRRIRESTRLW